MAPTLPISAADLEALVRDAWPGVRDVAGYRGPDRPHVWPAGQVVVAHRPRSPGVAAARLAVEQLARSIEGAGVDIEREIDGLGFVALGWAAAPVDGVLRRVRDLAPWHPAAEARTARLRRERLAADAPARAGRVGNLKTGRAF